MRNSKLGNLSIGIPTQSHMKTLTQFDDRSIIVNEQDDMAHHSNNELTVNQNLLLNKWLACHQKVQKQYVTDADNDPNRNGSCYMLQFQQFGDIAYRRKVMTSGKEREGLDKGEAYISKQDSTKTSKVYLKLIINMVNTQTSTYMSRTIEPSILQLEQKSPTMYKLSDPHLAIFFHSKLISENGCRIRIEFVIMESLVMDLQEVMQMEEYVGYCDVDPFKGLKNRQKTQIYSNKLAVNLDAYAAYTVLVSDSFKILEKLIPPNCLCTSEESIAGLAGRRLPNNIATLHYPIEYTQLHSLRIDIVSLDLPDSLIKAKIKESQMYAHYLYNLPDVNVKVKEVKLDAIFHNGWNSFSSASIKIEDKMEIQKKSSKKASAEVIKIKHFTAEELFNLPFIFLDEQSILIFQAVCHIEIKEKTGSPFSHNLALPLCYSYYIINKISVDDKQIRVLYTGDGLTQESGQFADKKNEAPGSRIEFYINIEHANKMNLSKHLLTIHSNKSNVNTQVDRILLEKERMIRENKKLKQMNRIKKIELNQEVPILDTTNFKENLYKNEIDRMRHERKEKQQVLEYLRKKLNQLSPQISDDANSEQMQLQDYQQYQRAFANRAISNSYYDAIFYQAALEKNQNKAKLADLNPDRIKVHSFPLFESAAAVRAYQSGEVPLDVIKTELLEKNYSYGIFINWVSLLPLSQDRKLPRKFYFIASLFTHENLQSCTCSINETTGQIVIADESSDQKKIEGSKEANRKNETNNQAQRQMLLKKKTQKITYVEIGPNPKLANNDSNFIQFISYLFHSELQIKVIDAISGIQFGEGFFKLKDIIRMRRNEVEVMRDVWINKQGEAKAKLKVQLKSIRKEPTQQAPKIEVGPSPIQTLSMEPEARQLQRIALFKKQRQPNSSAKTKIDRIINEELTKEELMVRVLRMKGQFIKVEVKNVKNITESYQVIINDPDRPFLVNQELVVVNRALYDRIVETGWWKYLLTIDSKYGLAIITDSNNCFELNPGQVGFILLFYYSDRKYQGHYLKDMSLSPSHSDHAHQAVDASKILKVYNHSRVVDLTLHNSSNRYLQCLYKVHILPQPDPCTINCKYVRKENSKVSISIPHVGNENFIIYIDDPTVLTTLNEQEGSVSLDCVVGAEGHCKSFNASILSPYPENRMLGNYHFQLLGACEISVEGRLWEMQDLLVDLHSSICLKKGLEFVLVLVEDQKVVTVRQKNPVKVNQKQAKTIIRLSIVPSMVGISHHELNIINPIDFSIVYRYVIKLNTQSPMINQRITLRIKLTDKILEEPFGFRNDLARKQKYRIVSTHPYILWCKQDSIEVEAKGEKKIKIVIHAQEVIESEAVILSFLGEKNSINYLFILELDSQLL